MGKHFNPWRQLRELGDHWRLLWHSDLPADVYGYTHFPSRTIVMRHGLSFEERRCTIAHEVAHVHRGPASRCSVVAEEHAVNVLVSRQLLPSTRAVADALVFNAGDYEAAAEDLWVDLWTFETRLGTLEPDESVYLSARLAEALLDGA